MTNVKIISCATDAYKLNADALTEEVYNKLPKQCKVIVDILKENGNELTRADLIGKLQEATETLITVGEGDKAVQKPRLETGQAVEKILGYYKKPLENINVLTVVKPPKTETKIKVAKSKKEKATEAEQPAKA